MLNEGLDQDSLDMYHQDDLYDQEGIEERMRREEQALIEDAKQAEVVVTELKRNSQYALGLEEELKAEQMRKAKEARRAADREYAL